MVFHLSYGTVGKLKAVFFGFWIYNRRWWCHDVVKLTWTMHGYRVVVAIMVNYSQTKIQMGIENNNIVIVNVLHILHTCLHIFLCTVTYLKSSLTLDNLLFSCSSCTCTTIMNKVKKSVLELKLHGKVIH